MSNGSGSTAIQAARDAKYPTARSRPAWCVSISGRSCFLMCASSSTRLSSSASGGLVMTLFHSLGSSVGVEVAEHGHVALQCFWRRVVLKML